MKSQMTLENEIKERIEQLTTHAQIPFSMMYWADLLERCLKDKKEAQEVIKFYAGNNCVSFLGSVVEGFRNTTPDASFGIPVGTKAREYLERNE